MERWWRNLMNDLMNQVASAGDLAESSTDMRIILSMFLFGFVILTFTRIIGFIGNLEKNKNFVVVVTTTEREEFYGIYC